MMCTVINRFEGFTPYNPENNVDRALHLRDRNGVDWYDCLPRFRGDTLKIVYRNDGQIVSAHSDASMLFPANLNVAEVVVDTPPALGDYFIDGAIVKRAAVAAKQQPAVTLDDLFKAIALLGERIERLEAKQQD